MSVCLVIFGFLKNLSTRDLALSSADLVDRTLKDCANLLPFVLKFRLTFLQLLSALRSEFKEKNELRSESLFVDASFWPLDFYNVLKFLTDPSCDL
jgi:hypothetical protein